MTAPTIDEFNERFAAAQEAMSSLAECVARIPRLSEALQPVSVLDQVLVDAVNAHGVKYKSTRPSTFWHGGGGERRPTDEARAAIERTQR